MLLDAEILSKLLFANIRFNYTYNNSIYFLYSIVSLLLFKKKASAAEPGVVCATAGSSTLFGQYNI